MYTAVPANIQLQKTLTNVSCHFVVAKKPSLLTNQRRAIAHFVRYRRPGDSMGRVPWGTIDYQENIDQPFL